MIGLPAERQQDLYVVLAQIARCMQTPWPCLKASSNTWRPMIICFCCYVADFNSFWVLPALGYVEQTKSTADRLGLYAPEDLIDIW